MTRVANAAKRYLSSSSIKSAHQLLAATTLPPIEKNDRSNSKRCFSTNSSLAKGGRNPSIVSPVIQSHGHSVSNLIGNCRKTIHPSVSLLPTLRSERSSYFSTTSSLSSASSSSSSLDPAPSSLLSEYNLDHPECNVSPSIASRVGKNLHLQSGHPLNIIKQRIETYWTEKDDEPSSFSVYDNFSPIVPTFSNFDSLLIPTDHVSRSKSDTYYLNEEVVLRTHTSAHQMELLKGGVDRFLVTGDVYRRDEIDSSHYPIFHQMEGVKMFEESDLDGCHNDKDVIRLVEEDLKKGLEGMAKVLFGDVEMRWVGAYFPFTDPSFELEIFFEGEWLEVLGCGVIHRDIVQSSGRGKQPGWAFGLGLERLAMVLFSIPDIRLFWSEDERFHSQFRSGKIVKFEPYSKYPACYKDISFWTGDDVGRPFHPNDLNEVVRDVAGDLVEKVELVDEFVHPKTNRLSNCFRISYRSMDRSLTNEEIDTLQGEVRTIVSEKLGVELR